MKLLLILLFISLNTFAADPFKVPEDEQNPETQEILIHKPEKYLRNESVIYDFNTDLGIKDQRKYTGTDRNRFSLAGHISCDYEHFNDILGLEVNYMRRTERYHQVWYGLQFFQHRTFFDAITQNHERSVSSDPNSEAQMQRPNNVKNNVFGGGLGMSYRFKLLLDFFPTEDVFESVDVFVNYLILDETYIKRKYSGYGLTTNYGIHKRSRTNFFYGGKISYNIASVTREAIAEESKSDRSFSLGWLTLGLELGFFF